MKRAISLGVVILLAMSVLVPVPGSAVELGLNANERPIDFNIQLLERAHAVWARAFVPVVPFYDRGVDPAFDPGLQRFKEVSDAGFKTILSLKHAFQDRRLPLPHSVEEEKYFAYVLRILKEMAPYSDIIVIGNEPFLEKQGVDMRFDSYWGGIPINIFYERLTELIYDFLQSHPDLADIPLYIGAFNRLHEPAMQGRVEVQRMLEFAERDPRIAGIDLHPHVSDFNQIEQQLRFARRYVSKPIIVTEWSLVWQFKARNRERLGVNAAGREFAAKYGLDPDMQVYQYINMVTASPVPQEQYHDFLKSRTWWDPQFLSKSYRLFEKYGVTIGTYAYTTPGVGPANFDADYDPWILNRLYIPRVAYTETGEVATTYGLFEEFVDLAQANHAVVTVGQQQIKLGMGREAYEVELPYGTTTAPRIVVDPLGGSPRTSNAAEFRVTQPESVPGTAVVETLDATGRVIHRASIHLRPAQVPDIHTVWNGQTLRVGEAVRSSGMVSLKVTSDAPEHLLERVKIALVPIENGQPLDGHEAVLYDDTVLPSDHPVDTRVFDDGAYEVHVFVAAVASPGFAGTYRIVLDNWEEVTDDFLPPVKSGWFAGQSQKKTVAESDGWTYAEDRSEDFFGDTSRLIRTEDSEQYLVWEAPGVERAVLTVYVHDVSLAHAISMSVSDDMTTWQALTVTSQEVERSATGWVRVKVVGKVPSDVPARFVRVNVAAEGVPEEAVQLGRMEIYTPKTS